MVCLVDKARSDGEPVVPRLRRGPRRQENRDRAARSRRRSWPLSAAVRKNSTGPGRSSRKKDRTSPRTLNVLVSEFPDDPLFASELAKLNVSPAADIPSSEFYLSRMSACTPMSLPQSGDIRNTASDNRLFLCSAVLDRSHRSVTNITDDSRNKN